MDTRAIASEYRLSHWAEIIRDRSASGKSIRSYCRSAGICEKVYYYWQRKVREAACRELLPTEADGVPKALVPSGWTVCAEEESTPAKKGITIEVGGFRVTVEADVDPELLAKTCRMLKTLC